MLIKLSTRWVPFAQQCAAGNAALYSNIMSIKHVLVSLQATGQAEILETMVPELEALRNAVQWLQGVEAQYKTTQKELEETKYSLAESSAALTEWQAAEQQHKALFGPIANLDPAAMAAKLDETLVELRLIRQRQEQVLEQQEQIRLNAEKAQLQKEMQAQKAKARQKAFADKAIQKYSSKPAYQAQPEELNNRTANNSDSDNVAQLAPLDQIFMTHSNEHDKSAMVTRIDESATMIGLFSTTRPQMSIERSTVRRTGIRGATQSPMPIKSTSQRSLSSTGQLQVGAMGQTMPHPQAARSPSPVYAPAKLQHALQKALGQLPKS